MNQSVSNVMKRRTMFSPIVFLTLLFVSSWSLVSAETVIACDGSVMRLSCETGVISVRSSTFGRNDSQTCSVGRPPEQISNTKCSMDVPAVSKQCDGRKVCSFLTQGFAGQDPCYGTYKYYVVNFICIPAETSVTCAAGYGSLKCDYGRIRINTANYGRTDTVTCSEGSPASEVQNTSCFAPNTRAVVSQICNGQTSCVVFATPTVFTDPCSGTSEYLSISYMCVPPEIRSSLACENLNNDLSCEAGRVIHIHSANFGRTDSSTCSAGRPAAQLAKTDCYGANSQSVVTNGCEGKPNCSIPASNSIFSDPCYGTFKFLYISYSCV